MKMDGTTYVSMGLCKGFDELMFRGPCHEAHRLSKRVPEDVQIIGFDDIPLCSLLYPALSTVHQPAYEMGKEAAGLLIKLIEHQRIDNRNIQLPVSFTERDTTRKVNKHG